MTIDDCMKAAAEYGSALRSHAGYDPEVRAAAIAEPEARLRRALLALVLVERREAFEEGVNSISRRRPVLHADDLIEVIET